MRAWVLRSAVAGSFLLLAAVPVLRAAATDPPIPNELRLYGTVSVAGANLTPASQTVIALVNGRACGSATTFLNGPSEPDDPGKTVYVIDVAASGVRANEVPGCGTAGAPVTLYFPLAAQRGPVTVAFSSGAVRQDVVLGAAPLPVGARAVLIANANAR